MERYLGMDVHQKSCTICVLEAGGKRVSHDVVQTHGQALVGYLKQQPGRLHLAIEEGEWTPWLCEILAPHVDELVVTHGEPQPYSKSDAIDAHQLAERLRTGQIRRPIFKAPRRYAKLRELARVYTLATRDVVRAKNRLKSRYRQRGIDCTGADVYSPQRRQEYLAELPTSLSFAVELLGQSLDQGQKWKQAASAAMVKEAHRFPIARVLESVPGLGPVRVAQMLPIVVTPYRFRTKRQFWSYCGFGVVTRSSADWATVNGQWTRTRREQTLGLSRRHNRTLKTIFKGAATTVLTQAKPTRFRTHYQHLCEQGTKPNLAKLTIARQIAATTLAIWKSKEAFDPKR